MNAKQYYQSGLSHYNLNTPNKNVSLAIHKFETAAEMGYADAYYFLGRIYGLGDHVSSDIDKSIYYYQIGYDQGSAKCGFSIALAYYGGHGLNKDLELAKTYFNSQYDLLISEAENDPVSMYIIGSYFYFGFSLKKSILKSIEWFKKSSDLGYSDAQYMLGMIHETVIDKQGSENTNALMYYELAAKQDHPYALYALAAISLEFKQFSKAVVYLERAAKQNYPLAAYTLGMYYHEHDMKNPLKAYEFFLQAAQNKHIEACYYVGLYYQQGKGVKKDLDMAISWYEKAALQKEKNALYHLAMILMKQDVKDMNQIRTLLTEAAHQNHPHAEYNLAVLYQKGDGVEKDIKKSIYYYQKASDANLAIAQYNLGMLYYEGISLEKDEHKAKQLWQKAADQGLEAAVKLMLSINNYEKLQKSKWQS